MLDKKTFFYRNPAFFLLLFVFLIALPYCLSYQNAWVQPELIRLKAGVIKTGTALNVKDIQNGLFWQFFEYAPRCTRPLSSYFEIIDTKFRIWLWNYILPHPSLSLSWIFSLIIAPILVFKLLRNYGIGTNIAYAMTAFYLITPGILSGEAMLFRPAKPMANFFILFSLYLASRLNQKNKEPSFLGFFYLWATTALSFYWDETALILFPALFFIFPHLFKAKKQLLLWLSLPIITFIGYYKIIPFLCNLAGHGQPKILKYNKLANFFDINLINSSLKYLYHNTINLVFDTMGIFTVPVNAPYYIKLGIILCACSWALILFYCIRSKLKWNPLFIFLLFLILFFNALMTVTMQTWGPYYYGSFWSIFFIIFIADMINNANIPPRTLTICFFFIIFSTIHCFIGTNNIYKRYHWYPYSPGTISEYFNTKRIRFNPNDELPFKGKELKDNTLLYWAQVRNGINIDSFYLPKELGWLPIEVEPTKAYNRYLPGLVLKSSFDAKFPNDSGIYVWLWQQGYMVRSATTGCFVRENMEAVIKPGLMKKYPSQWKEIFEIMQDAENRKPDYFYYKSINPSLNNKTITDAQPTYLQNP